MDLPIKVFFSNYHETVLLIFWNLNQFLPAINEDNAHYYWMPARPSLPTLSWYHVISLRMVCKTLFQFSSLGQMVLVFSFTLYPKDHFYFSFECIIGKGRGGALIMSSSAHKRSLTQITSHWALKLLKFRLIWSHLGFPLVLLSSLSTVNSGT